MIGGADTALGDRPPLEPAAKKAASCKSARKSSHQPPSRYATREGDLVALSNVNLEMRGGDFVVAIGASGCGKTTLLRCSPAFFPPPKARRCSTASR